MSCLGLAAWLNLAVLKMTALRGGYAGPVALCACFPVPTMNVTVCSTQPFERDFLQQAHADRHHLQLLEAGLDVNTVPLAQGSLAVSVFTADEVSGPMLEQLWAHGVRYLLVRATGHRNVDLATAHRLTYPNVVVTGHQAYLTREALADIAGAAVASFDAWGQGHAAEHEL